MIKRCQKIIPINHAPVWLPERFKRPGESQRFECRFSRPERKVYRRHLPIKPSTWVGNNRVLTDGKLSGSKVDFTITPWVPGIIDASFYPTVRRIILCKPVQSAGSTTIHSCLAYAMARRPGNTLIAGPDRNLAVKTSKDRFQPMIEASPALKALLTGVDDDVATMRIKLNNMLIYFGWSGSAASLGDFPAMYVVKEEADKWQEFPSKDEAGSHDLIDQRVTTFEGEYKIWDNSTPTVETGHIWASLTKATEFIFDFWVCCPDCNHYHVMIFGKSTTSFGIKWDGGLEVDPVVVASKRLARYVCPHCGVEWSDYRRNLATQSGEWRGTRTSEWLDRFNKLKEGDHTALDGAVKLFPLLEKYGPEVIGFHPTAWFSTFVSLSKSAAAFLRGQGNTPEAKKALRSFQNNFAAEPWYHHHQERAEDRILALCDDRPPLLVPGGGLVAGLWAGVDTHGPGSGSGFYFIIRAYGWAKAWMDNGQGGYVLVEIPQEKWLVRKGFVESFAGLEKVLLEDRYTDKDGLVYPVQRVVQDAMGRRTKEVYDFARKYRGWLHPFKGERTMSQPWRFTNIEFYPGSNTPIPGGVMLLRGNVTIYKSSLSTNLTVAPGDPGCRWLHASVERLVEQNYPTPSLGVDYEYARHLTAEYVDEKGFFDCPEGRSNEFWDCEVYADIGADVSQVGLWEPPKPTSTVTVKPKSRVLSRGVEV